MKTLLSFSYFFPLSSFFCPLGSVESDKTENVEAKQQIKRFQSPPVSQSGRKKFSFLSGDASQPVQDTLATLQVSQPEYFLFWTGTGQIEKVAVIDYLYGAVAAELPPGFPQRSDESPTVASHTYALYCREHPVPELGGADFQRILPTGKAM